MKLAKNSETSSSIFVRNVPFSYTDEDVSVLLSNVCEVKKSFIVTDKKTRKPKGYAFIKLRNPTDLEKACKEINGKSIEEGVVLQAEPAIKNKKDTQQSKQPNGENNKITKDANIKSRFILLMGIPRKLKIKSLKIRLRKISQVDRVIIPSPESTLDTNCARIIAKSIDDAPKARRKSVNLVKKTCAGHKKIKNFSIKTVLMPPSTKITRLIVRNIGFNCDRNALERLFQPFGQITDLNLEKRDDNSDVNKGYAFVEFEEITSAENALETLNGTEVCDRKIVVDWAVSKTHFEKITEKRSAFASNLRETKTNNKKRKLNGKDKTKEEVEEYSEEEKVEDKNTSEVFEPGNKGGIDKEGKNKTVNEKEDNNKIKKSVIGDASKGKTLFVSNLPPEATEENLKEVFKRYGRINYIKLVLSESGSNKGSGFVQFRSKKSALKALGFDSEEQSQKSNKTAFIEKEILGKLCRVSIAVPHGEIDNIKKRRLTEDKKNSYLINEGIQFGPPEKLKGAMKSIALKNKISQDEKIEKMKNPNFFISKTRLSVHNIPPKLTEKELKKVFLDAAWLSRRDKTNKTKYETRKPELNQVKIVRDNNRKDDKGSFRSKRYGFVEFKDHGDALNSVREMSKKYKKERGGLQVEFAVEDVRKAPSWRKEIGHRVTRIKKKRNNGGVKKMNGKKGPNRKRGRK